MTKLIIDEKSLKKIIVRDEKVMGQWDFIYVDDLKQKSKTLTNEDWICLMCEDDATCKQTDGRECQTREWGIEQVLTKLKGD